LELNNLKWTKFLEKFLFHRISFIVFALLIQLAVLIGVILKFSEYFVFFYAASILISLAAILVIINNNTNPAYKLAWVIPILVFPIFGGLFYVFFGFNKLGRKTRKKMKSIEIKTKEALKPNWNVIEDIRAQSAAAANQARYIQEYAYCPPYLNTCAEYLPTGEATFERMVEELKKARYFIFLEFFIIREGLMWDTILDILVEKVSQGVDVRLIYDDVGCLFNLPYKYNKYLESLGIKCRVFNPLKPVLSRRHNNRDHRKIMVIDGIVGFTGGNNLADEYINEFERFGNWKDSAIMLKGEAVWSLTVTFLSMWDYLSGLNEDFGNFKPNEEILWDREKDGYIQPFADNPLDDEPVGEIVYLNIISKAENYLYITTPYLIIGNEMEIALAAAAKRGVDVRIITPYIADKWPVHELTRSNYKPLIENGVKIYEYTPGFIHSKTYISDDIYGVVGTINMDYRSLYLHFECGVWMYKCSVISDMKEDFLKTLEKCKLVTLEDMNSVRWYRRLFRAVLRILAPLM